MASKDMAEEMIEIAQARWDEQADQFSEKFQGILTAWSSVIVSLRRLRLLGILAGLHVPPRVAIALAVRWPVRWLPAFDLDRWSVDRKTLPGCPRTG